MKAILSEIRRGALITLVLAVICCGAYPLLVFVLSQAFFPGQANGSLIPDGFGGIQGSKLIGQPFSSDRYFHSRPSAAGNGYDSTSSGGSNLGPTSQKLRDSIAQNVADYRSSNEIATNAQVPVDAVTASASGLDPHISPENATLQAPRVAKARGLPLDAVRQLINQHTAQPAFGFLGDPGVNVLELNLALDRTGSEMP
jgi:K+-transporting ATPase ATPase C chain